MKESIRQRLEKMTDRFEEVGRLLATADIAGGSQQFRDLSMEYARLQPLAEGYRGYHNLERDLVAAQEMLADSDPDMRTLGEEEVGRVGRDIATAEADLRKLLSRRTPATIKISSWRSGPVPAATKRPSLRATCFGCTHALPRIMH